MAVGTGLLDTYFKITERGSTVSREVRGGVVTFVAMAYIVVLNPLILGSFSADDATAKVDVLGNILPINQVAAVTALVAGLMSIVFGIIANYPFALAAGLGINSLLAVSIAPQVTWPEAMGLVVIDGIIIVILALTGFRTAVFNAIPPELKSAIAAGIGAFIAFIGLVDAGFVRRIPDAAGTTVPVGLGIDGSIASWPTAVFVFGVLLMGVLVVRKVRGGLLIGIVITTVVAAIVQAITDVGPSMGTNRRLEPEHPPRGARPDRRHARSEPGRKRRPVRRLHPDRRDRRDAARLHPGARQLLRRDGHDDRPGQGSRPRRQGRQPAERGPCARGGGHRRHRRWRSVLVVEHRVRGVGLGYRRRARTGLANVVTGVLFLAAMFLTPLYEMVPIEAAAPPALIVVGA